jgi:HK97 family phage major capsid protein
MRRDELRELAEQEKRLHTQMLQLDEDARKEKRSFTAEEQEQFDKLCTDFESTRETRTRAEKLFVQEREVESTLGTPIEKRVGDFGDAATTFKEWKEQRNGGGRYEDQPEFRSAFWHYLGAQSTADLDVEEHRALSKGTTTAGGFAVPTGFYNQLINISRFMGSMGQLANEIITDSGETLQVPTVTAHGVMSWTGESAAYTPSDETFGQVSLAAYKGTTKIIVSEELLQDVSFDLEAYLANEFGERLGVGQNTAFIKGDGTNKPTGIIQTAGTASNLGADFAAAVGNATSFNYTALVSAIFTLPPQYRRGASFIVNDASARNLYLMQDTQNRPLWNVNVATTGPDTFLGYPIYTDPDMPAPAAGNISAVFGNWNRVYTVRRVRGLGIQRQNELHSDNGQVGFRAYERVDGKVVFPLAGIGLKHSAT